MVEHDMMYYFGEGPVDKKLLGGKGANLGKMRSIGLPVPPGFTITTEVCNYYTENRGYPEGFMDRVRENINRIEEEMEKEFGSEDNPLLVSVRSGAAISMPGMMDTVLNLGLNDKSVKGLAKQTNNERFAYDCYRRLIQMFGDVVLGMKHEKFENLIEEVKEIAGVENDIDLTKDDLKEIVKKFKNLIRKDTDTSFPQDPQKQLKMGIDAVFESWDNERAKKYRKANDIPDDLGTAVNVQTMVFGNMGEDSGTGVGFTRNPSTGKNELYGEYLINAQGEDVVAGIRTPHPLQDLNDQIPEAYEELQEVRERLEEEYEDMQDFEFTIQEGKLWMLQTRTGKRTAAAAVKIAVDMCKENIIDKETAVMRVDPDELSQILHKRIDPEAEKEVIGKGLNASPGAAEGKIVFYPEEAVRKEEAGEKVIMVRKETSPEDIDGLMSSQGIVTSRGGMTSHAAVVARGMGKPCVAGCEDADIDMRDEKVLFRGEEFSKGDYITIDGGTGEVLKGKVEMIDPQISGGLEKLLEWAEEYRKLGVRANADTPSDAQKARDFGAEGIGLCRTEHMFMAEDRMKIMREMISAENEEERREALGKLLPMQREDFEGIFKVMEGYPTIIRLLDPPLHEFLPAMEELLGEVVERGLQGKEIGHLGEMLERVKHLKEANPMLGFRGCRLGIIHPEIFEMQVRAIIRAAIEVKQETGNDVTPYIMIPLVSIEEEFEAVKDNVKEVAEEEIENSPVSLDYKIGTMIELPRACVIADKIAEEAEFFSFGTNDLTQTTFGFSRDDAEAKFFKGYEDEEIIKADPFQQLDGTGVGKLMEMAINGARETKPEISLGLCGEHGGDPESIKICKKLGLDYVSCSPYRVPIARLACAQAEIEG